mgnify:CR=1 FL=1
MANLILTGFLICRTLDEADRVAALLPDHIRLTRAEPGCLLFEVVRSMADPVRFAVREIFASKADFDAHQARIKDTVWARGTKGIPRDYVLTEGDKARALQPAVRRKP